MSEVEINKPKVAGKAIRIIGAGSVGIGAVNRLIEMEMSELEFYAVAADPKVLASSIAPCRICVAGLSDGFSGGDSEDGPEVAGDEAAAIRQAVDGAEIVLVLAGLDDATSAGAASAVAGCAKAAGALVIGVAMLPPTDGEIANPAESDAERLRCKVDVLVGLPGDRLERNVADPDGFKTATEALGQCARGLYYLLDASGSLIACAIDDFRCLTGESAKPASMGVGTGRGENRALAAMAQAVNSPLLHESIAGAKKVLISFCGSCDLELKEMSVAVDWVVALADPESNIIYGARVDDKMTDEVWVAVYRVG